MTKTQDDTAAKLKTRLNADFTEQKAEAVYEPLNANFYIQRLVLKNPGNLLNWTAGS